MPGDSRLVSCPRSRWPPSPCEPPTPCPPGTRGRRRQAILKFVAEVTKEGAADVRASGRAHRHLRQRRHPLVGAAHLLPGGVRPRAGQGAGAAASGMEDPGALQDAARRRRQGSAGPGREGDPGHHGRDPHRHDHRGVLEDGERLGGHREAPALRTPLHRDGLPADARAARLPARQRLQDLHRLRRRRRVHARLGRRRSTAFRPSRSWAAAGSSSSRCDPPGQSW